MNSTCLGSYRKWRRTLFPVVGAAVLFGATAQAETLGGTMQTSITIQEGCLIGDEAGGDMDFGVLDFGVHTLLTAPVDSDSSGASPGIVVTCSNSLSYSIGIDRGSVGSTIGDRRMTNGTDQLSYQLYSDAARTQVWGDGAGAPLLTGTGTGAAVGHVVYARVPAQEISSAGAYTDTVNITVSW